SVAASVILVALARVTQEICRSRSDRDCWIRLAVASAFSDMPSLSELLMPRYLIQTSIAPLMANTNTTRPTSATTYLANRPSRRNPALSLTSFIRTLVRRSLRACIGLSMAPVCLGCPDMRACLARIGERDCGSAHMVSRDYRQESRDSSPYPALLNLARLRGEVGA